MSIITIKLRYNSIYIYKYVNVGLGDFTVSNSYVNEIGVISYYCIMPIKKILKQIRLN